jgi:AcrR family transcriptional regulator
MSKGSETFDRLVRSGVSIGSAVGISRVTMGDLATEAGLSKSGLFAHFGSKAELQIALFAFAKSLARHTVADPAFTAPIGLRRLRALIDNWFGWARQAELPGGCPFASAAFEFDDVEGPVRDSVVSAHHEWVGLLEALTRDAVSTGELRFDLDVEQFVWELHGIYLSHHVSDRLLRDPRAENRRRVAVDRLVGDATTVTIKQIEGNA